MLALLGGACLVPPLYLVPGFERIYEDALPGQCLPAITVVAVNARALGVAFAILWPLAGVTAASRQSRHTMLVINLGYLFLLALIGVWVFALFVPISGGLVTGVSETPSTRAVGPPH